MKKHLLLVLILFIFASCGGKFSQSLKNTDALLSSDLSQGQKMLDSICQQGHLSDADLMYCKLLKLKARDKSYEDIKDRELIDSLLTYFEGVGDDKLLAETYFYAGRVSYEYGDSPQALSYYQKAEQLVDENDYALQGDIFCQMANIYRLCNLPSDALRVLKKAYIADSLSGNIRNVLYDIRDISQSFVYKEDYDSALVYANRGKRMAYEQKDTFMLQRMYHLLASIYNQKGDYRKSEKYFLKCLGRTRYLGDGKSGLYIIVSNVYHHLGKKKLAQKYDKWLLDSGTIWGKKHVCEMMIENMTDLGNSDQIKKYFLLYKSSCDSIWRVTNVENVKKIEQLYNYSLKEKEKKQLVIANEKKKIVIILGLVFISLVSVFGVVFYKVRMTSARQREMLLKLRIAKYQDLLEKKKVETLQNVNEKKQKIEESLIYQYVISEVKAKSYKMSASKWEELHGMIDSVYPEFFKNLYELSDVSEHEERVCSLLKIKIRPVDIAGLTNHSKEAITALRRRLYFKVFQKKGSPDEWDKVIEAL